MGPTTTLTGPLDRSTIRLNITNDPLVLRVANKTRPQASSCSETEGVAETLTLLDRTAEVVASCYEYTDTPAEDVTQRHMDPDVQGDATTQVAIVPPSETHTRYADDTTTTFTTHLADITDVVPDLPATYDADVDGGVVPTDRILGEGNSIVLSGSLTDNLIRFTYRLGGGLGVDCTEIKGYADVGTLCVDCVRSINGVSAAGGALKLVAGAGVGLLPDQAGHRILVLINAQDQLRAQP